MVDIPLILFKYGFKQTERIIYIKSFCDDALQARIIFDSDFSKYSPYRIKVYENRSSFRPQLKFKYKYIDRKIVKMIWRGTHINQ